MGIKPSQSQEPPRRPTPSVHAPTVISFAHYTKPGEFCLSTCTSDEIREYLDALRMLCSVSWIEATRLKGLGLKHIVQLSRVTVPSALSDGIPIFEIRASSKARCFGGKKDNIFFVLWFDRNHDICPV